MERKNIILITIDALRALDVGCVGGGNLTPNIDDIAKESILFNEALSNGPGTPQSFPSILASIYPLMNEKIILSEKYTTLARVLERHHFETAGFHSNPFLSKFFGWNRGFSEFRDLFEGSGGVAHLFRGLTERQGLIGTLLKPIKKVLSSESIRRTLKRIYYGQGSNFLPYADGESVNRAVVEWLERKKRKRFFLWIHYMDPHEPYFPPGDWLSSICSREEASTINRLFCLSNNPECESELVHKAKQLYDAEVRYVDYCVGELIGVLERLSLIEDTVMLITADHGEGFLEHGERGHQNHILYDEVLRVPLIIYGLNERTQIAEPVQLLDVSPTILAVLGIDTPRTFCGNDLRLASGKGIISESARFDFNSYEYDFRKRVVSYRTKEWKLIVNHRESKMRLYNLYRDPEEEKNVLDENKDLARQFVEKIACHVEKENLFKKRGFIAD